MKEETRRALRLTAADPAGNITLLVETPAAQTQYERIARQLLAMPALDAEQVGFLCPPRLGGAVRLEMMGGEFCGNAARCTGLYYAARHGVHGTVPVEISGCSHVLSVEADPEQGAAWAEMPLPEGCEQVLLCSREMTMVRFEGMLHLVAPCAPLPEAEVAALLPRLAQQKAVPAVGLLFVEGAQMTPAVYVRDTDSLVWERSCASGSTAVACCDALRRGDGVHRLALRQPGGTIETEVRVTGGALAAVRIGGSVRLSAPQEVYLPEGV